VSQCPTCKQILEPGVRFCPHDGTPVTETAAVSTVPTPTGQGPKSREIELPTVVGGRYRLVEYRGGGGMAKVYRGTDQTLQREVAVKLISPELRVDPEFDARFEREARIASQLADPHIVVVHDFGLDDTHGPFLVMEFLQGQSLRERLQAEGPVPLKAGLQLGAQMLLALIHAHAKNIVHRDIKPDNVFLLNQSGVRLHVRVLDFGIARIFRRDNPSDPETITNPGAVLGTPRYMSPEQLAGQPVDARSDIYSAAVVLHEALTGHLPYVSGKKLCELCPEATQPLQDLLDHCLKPNPAERPPSAVEVYLRLQDLGRASGILLLPPGAMDKMIAARHATDPTVAYVPPELGRKRTVRRRLLIGAAVLLAVIAAAVPLVAHFLPTPATPLPPQESLLGIKVGDPREEVWNRLNLESGDRGNPWAVDEPPQFLGHVLTPADLQLQPEELARLEFRVTKDALVCVLLHEGRVRALVARQTGAGTGRQLKVGDPVQGLYDKYKGEQPTDLKRIDVTAMRLGPREFGGIVLSPGAFAFSPPGPKAPPKKKTIEVHRYDTLGVAFEFDGPHISAITLYPAVKNP
jgi:tRNA A-37 threonylcarbamoyl transferase component Bud32